MIFTIRFASTDTTVWAVTGIVTGVFTWTVLRYVVLRLVGRIKGAKRKRWIKEILCTDLVFLVCSTNAGIVLMTGF